MLDVFNFPTPQSANYQAFYGGIRTNRDSEFTWTKPRGASMVRFLLIGAGGSGGSGSSTNGGGGGGSGAVTSWIGPAIFVPDSLQIRVGGGMSSAQDGEPSAVYYYSPVGAYQLLIANGGNAGLTSTGGAGGLVLNPTLQGFFSSAGILNSVAGQDGVNGSATGNGSNISLSATTFLSGGAGGAGGSAGTGGSVQPNYAYPVASTTSAGGSVKGADGYFYTQPIMVGRGGAGGTTSTSVGTAGGRGGIGCGGGGAGEDGGSIGGLGGNGAVFVWAW